MEDQMHAQVREALKTVKGLISKYGDQASQLKNAEDELLKSRGQLADIQQWCEQASENLNTLTRDCTTILAGIASTLDTQRFSELCKQIEKLGEALEGCVTVKDSLVSVRPDIEAYADSRFAQLNTLLTSCNEELKLFAEGKEGLLSALDERIKAITTTLEEKSFAIQYFDERLKRLESAIEESNQREEMILTLLRENLCTPSPNESPASDSNASEAG